MAAHAPATARSVPSRRGRGGRQPRAQRAIRKTAAPTVERSASWPSPNESNPVCERPGPNWIPYQGKSMLAGTASAPTAASRAGGGRERKSSIQRLASTVAGVHFVPPRDLVLAQRPAEVHLLAVADRGEVDQAAVDVPDHHLVAKDREEQP